MVANDPKLERVCDVNVVVVLHTESRCGADDKQNYSFLRFTSSGQLVATVYKGAAITCVCGMLIIGRNQSRLKPRPYLKQ